MNPSDPRAYLGHVRNALTRILESTRNGRDDVLTSPIIQDAAVRNLEAVGQAVQRLDEAAKLRAADVPWRRIAGMRDVLVHEYFGVDARSCGT